MPVKSGRKTKDKAEKDKELDEALEETFPASDPPPLTPQREQSEEPPERER